MLKEEIAGLQYLEGPLSTSVVIDTSLLIYGRNSAILSRPGARKNLKEDEQRMGEEKTSFSPVVHGSTGLVYKLVYEK